MTDEHKQSSSWWDDEEASWYLLAIAGCVSFFWIGGLFGYWRANPEAFAQLVPNTLGDWFAGAFGPLAALWLIVAVTLQRMEFSNQLREFRESVAQIRRQADTAAAEAERRALETAVVSDQQWLGDLWRQIGLLAAEMRDCEIIAEDGTVVSAEVFGNPEWYNAEVEAHAYPNAETHFVDCLNHVRSAATGGGLTATSVQMDKARDRLKRISALISTLEQSRTSIKAEHRSRLPDCDFGILRAEVDKTVAALQSGQD